MSKATNKNRMGNPNRKPTDKVILKPRSEGPITRPKTPKTKEINYPIVLRRPVAKPMTPDTPGVVVGQTTATNPEPTSVSLTPSFHPVAEIFSVLGDDHLQALASDIALHGLLEPVTRYEGKILDGRCRYLACKRVGVAPTFQEYSGEDPLGFVISRNVHRRQLTKAQRVIAAARTATLPVGANQATPGLPIGRAAEIFQVSARTIARAKVILRRGTPDLVQAVEAGKVTISRAAELCELVDEKQTASVNEIAERKHNPRKKKRSAGTIKKNGPAGTVNENTAVGQIGGKRPPERSPGADRNPSGDPEIPDRPDAAGAVRENEAAYVSLIAAWSRASNSVRLKFIENVVRKFQSQRRSGQ